MDPRIASVGSGPIENIIRNIVAATKVLTPEALGNVKTMAPEINITAHIRPER